MSSPLCISAFVYPLLSSAMQSAKMPASCILSTGNIMSAGAQVIRKPTREKSNTELINSLRENFKLASSASNFSPTSSNSSVSGNVSDAEEWTSVKKDGVLHIPATGFDPGDLAEDREEYDITVKLFYLPNVPASSRCKHTTEAVRLVNAALGTSNIDLLIVSLPNISFDADDDELPSSPSDIAEWVQTYRTLESLHASGTISKIGLSEFGTARLSQFLPNTKVKPSVDQINVRDCCVVPRSLIMYAKERGIELLTHNDCTDILPSETLKTLLVKEFGVLGEEREVVPQWVVKYTAVIKSRGVVENKGYIAMAEIH